MRGPVALVARRLDCTEGQLYTMVIGLVLALLLAVPGIPAVLGDRPTSERGRMGLRPYVEPPAAGTSLSPGGARTSTGDTGTFAAYAPPLAGSVRIEGPVRAEAGPTPSDVEVPPGTIGVFARVGPPGAPGGLAVATDGTVFVTTDNGAGRGGRGPSHLFAYRADGTLLADRTIAGQREEREGGLTGAAVDPLRGDVAVLDPASARILRIDISSGAQTLLATIPDLPACLASLGAGLCHPGIDDRKPYPVSAVYDRLGNLFLTDPAQDTIWRLRPGARSPEVWYQSLYFSAGDGPYGIAVDGGAIEFTVGTSIDPSAFDAGGLYRLAVNDDGSAGGLTLVHAFGPGDHPGALAAADSGASYVVLRNSGAIVSFAPDGTVSGRIDPPGTGPIPLDAPSAIAHVPGALLVANGRTSADPSRWAVLEVFLGR